MKLDVKQMMQQAQQMQEAMAAKQRELASRTYEAQAGGGMVTAVVNGRPELVSLAIDPSVVRPDDVEMLQDLIVAAVGEAYRQASEAAHAEMAGMLGGLGNLQQLIG